MFRSALILFTAASISGATAADSTHSMKSADGKSIEVTWWESMAICYGRFQAIGQYVESQGKGDAKALLDYSNVAHKLSIKRLMDERRISMVDAKALALPVAQLAVELTAQGFTKYRTTSEVDQKNDELVGSCVAEFNDYAKAFPEELKTGP